MANYKILLISKIQRRLETLKKLNWKFKLFIVLLVCTITVIYPHGTEKKVQFSSLALVLKKVNSTKKEFEVEAPPQANWTDGFAQLSQKEIIILQITSFWGTTFPTAVLDSDKCSILKTGTTQQPPISQIFDIPCRITYEKKYLNESHAVVFHSPDLWRCHPAPELPRTLFGQNQIWVWYETESPLQGESNLTKFQNVFNWTMSYRRDSDVYYPYGYIFPSNVSNSHNTTPEAAVNVMDNPPDHRRKSLKMKSGLAAWIVSTCISPSNREYFVNELQKYITVDIYGTCGQRQCPQIQDKGYFKCYKHIQSKYKFYLAFENSLCLDYITEKFYLALQSDMVPVVYGGGIDDQMDYLAVAPENSFIDARKFKSPQDLANYLIYLDGNDDEYLKYFEWKAKYQVVYKDYGPSGLGWCNLCQRVFEQTRTKNEPLWNKWYSDLHTWWNYTLVFNTNAQLPLDSQSKLAVSPIGQSFLFNGEKVKSTCVPARTKDNFTFYEEYYKVT